MKRFVKCIMMLCLIMTAMSSLVIPAFAANESYDFSMKGNQSQIYTVCDNINETTGKQYHPNMKTIPGDPATIKVASGTTFPTNGYVWAFRLYYFSSYNANSDADNKEYSPATNPLFVRGYDTFHPTYLAGENITGRNYWIGGRLDDRVTDPNCYNATGKFNADYTNPQ